MHLYTILNPFCFYLQILNVTKIRRENNEDSVIRQGLNHSIHGRIKKQSSHSFSRGVQRRWKEFSSIFEYVIEESLKQLGQFFKQYLLHRANIINVYILIRLWKYWIQKTQRNWKKCALENKISWKRRKENNHHNRSKS